MVDPNDDETVSWLVRFIYALLFGCGGAIAAYFFIEPVSWNLVAGVGLAGFILGGLIGRRMFEVNIEVFS